MVGTTIVLARIPVIKFRKGGIGRPSALPAAAAAAKPAPAISAAVAATPTATAPAVVASTASHQPMVSITKYQKFL